MDQIYEMFDKVVEFECCWINYIVGNNIFGIMEFSMEQYIKYFVNSCLWAIGLDFFYMDVCYGKSFYIYLECFFDMKKEVYIKVNFFEVMVISYVMFFGVFGWDEIQGIIIVFVFLLIMFKV